MKKTIESGKKKLNDIFDGNNQFYIPFYQRCYSWEKKQIDDFWDDFKTDYPNDYYYGTILLQNKDKEKNTNTNFYIVDGQQRLTTLVIFVYCLLKRMKEINHKKDALKLTKEYIIHNHNYVFNLQSDDNDFFHTHILSENPAVSLKTPSQEKLQYAKETFSKKLSNIGAKEIDKIIKRISSTNVLIYLMTDETESAMVFETTNDRGKSLTNLEKTKSYLMYKASILDDQKDQVIGQIHSRFSEIYKSYTNLENKIKDENSILAYSFIANEKWKNSGKYKKEYQHYMEIMKDTVEGFIKSKNKNGLIEYIDRYTQNIKDSFSALEKMLSAPCDGLNALLYLGNIANFYPLLIKCYKKDKTKEKRYYKDICRLCEIFSFRVYAIIKKRADAAKTSWYNLARDFDGDFSKLKDDILKLIDENGNKNTFMECLKDKKFYKVYSTNVRNYFFWKYENYLRTTFQPYATPMPFTDLQEKQNKKNVLTIEHIVAQANSSEQSKIITDYSIVDIKESFQDFVEKYLHSIGNLTIDPLSANVSKGKNDVDKKIDKYFEMAPYKCQNELKEFLISEKWSIKSIENREEKLIKFAETTWCKINNETENNETIQ